MIAEDVLERGLAGIASEYDVPAEGADRIAELLSPSVADEEPIDNKRRLHRPTTRGWLMLAAAGLVIIVIASFAVGGGGGNVHRSNTEAGGASSNDAITAGGASGGSSAGQRLENLVPAVPRAAPSPVHGQVATGLHAYAGVGSGATAGGVTTGSSTTVPPAPSAPSKVIKTGELDLQVPKGRVSAALNLLTGIATFERGYIEDSRTSEGGGFPTGEITMRVPVATFDDTVNRSRTIKIDNLKVLSLLTSGKDVTSKYVDLKARISALSKTRHTFLTILSRATTIGETLAVQQHITDVQTQIEQLKGEKKVLAGQAALSTLTVTVDQKVTTQATVTHHKSGLHKAIDRSVSRFVHGIEGIIGILGPVLLVVLILGFGWLAARFGYRVLRRRMV